MYQKQFSIWNDLKQQVNLKKVERRIRIAEVRWIIFGVNVGSEIDGKGNSFIRPGLILHVHGNDLALVIPLTSKRKELPGYFPFDLADRSGSLCVHQIKVVSQNRILSRIERISDSRLSEARQNVITFFGLYLISSAPVPAKSSTDCSPHQSHTTRPDISTSQSELIASPSRQNLD